MPEYTIEDARDEAFDIIEDFLENEENHFETGQKAADTLVKIVMAQHIMPMDEPQAQEFVKQYLTEHADIIDLSQVPKTPDA